MLQSLIVTLREGVEAALLIGIVVAYLNKSGRSQYIRIVYAALGTAILASIGAAYLLRRANVNEELMGGVVLIVAAVFVATMVYWMHRTSKTLKRGIEERLENISTGEGSSAFGVFAFVFLMVFREGAETVLMLSAVSMNSDDLLNFFGGVIGLALAVIFGIVFVRGTVRLDLRKFFKVTTVILLCVVFQLLLTGLHELSEAKILPSSREEMALIGPIVGNSVFFFVAILALAALMVLFDWRSRQSSVAAHAATTGAAQRMEQWQARRDKIWTAAVCVSAFVFVVLVTAEFIYAKNQKALSPATPVTGNAGMIRIPISEVSDGNLHRFLYDANDSHTRFIVLKAGDKLNTALDACEICGAQGYYQKGAEIYCKNCSSAIYGPTIGLVGGCNPVPLASVVEGSDLVIRLSDLESGAKFFAAAAQ